MAPWLKRLDGSRHREVNESRCRRFGRARAARIIQKGAMLRRIQFIIAACGLLFATAQLGAQQPGGRKLDITVLKGPATARLESIAQVEVPGGFVFLDGKSTQALLKEAGQPVSGKELGWLRPTNADWSVMFEFDDRGYVKDDDKDKLDAAKLLSNIKAGNDAANEERKRMGSPTIEVVGWDQPPHYDEASHNLEWAIRGRCDGRDILNYNTRLLGRKGVMEVVLIVDPADLPATLPAFKNLLAAYKFQSGQTYAEYRPGDKVAKYGLAALVVGGAAVGAAKLGLLGPLLLILKKAWKLVIVAFAAVAAFFKKLVGRLTGRRSNTDSAP